VAAKISAIHSKINSLISLIDAAVLVQKNISEVRSDHCRKFFCIILFSLSKSKPKCIFAQSKKSENGINRTGNITQTKNERFVGIRC
jgi:hypothetical protein